MSFIHFVEVCDYEACWYDSVWDNCVDATIAFDDYNLMNEQFEQIVRLGRRTLNSTIDKDSKYKILATRVRPDK